MSHHHFSICERAKIEELNKLGLSSRQIGKRIKRHHSSIARELNRLGEAEKYTAETAQADYSNKRTHSKPYVKLSKELEEVITEKLLATWSPEQISNTVTKGKVSFKTIYTWIYKGYLSGVTPQKLRRKGKKKTSQTAKHFARGTSIQKRPKEVYSRKTFGHWELDTV